MPYANQITLSGHLAKDPELRYGKEGTGFTKFTVAVQRDYGEEVDWIRCTVFNRGNYKLAEYIADDCKKGKLITIFGELQIDTYEDKEGNSKRSEQVIVDKAVYEREKKQEKQGKIDDDLEEDFDVDF